jgi:hypothetical protein
MRKKAPEFPEELGRERFVVADDERGHLHFFDDLCHRESLARAGNSLENLKLVAGFYAVREGRDCLALVARGLER